MCTTSENCVGVYDAEYVATYAAAGRRLSQALREASVDRYDTVTWQTEGGETGTIDLDLIQSHDLLTIMDMAGLPRDGYEVTPDA